MKILHTSPKGLPDWRIERQAYIANKRGHEVAFLGLGKKDTPHLNPFEEIVMKRSINNRQAVLDKDIRREWKEAVLECSPDLIHANDLIAAKFSTGLGIPVVYDDHEYWSAQRVIYRNWPLWKRIAIRPFLKTIPVWEREILLKHVTITVSEAIAAEHRKICKHVFVLHNYNLRTEVEGLPTSPNRSGVVYAGADFDIDRFSPHRDMTGLREWLQFDVLSGFPRNILFRKLTEYRIGLVPFIPVPYHKYADSTKTYDYLNCGLQVLMNRTLYDAHGRLPYTYPFDTYSDLSRVIQELENASPSEIMAYANRNLVWEAQEDLLFEAYDKAMSCV